MSTISVIVIIIIIDLGMVDKSSLFIKIFLILRFTLFAYKVFFDRRVEARCEQVDLLLCNLPHTFSCTERCTSAGVTVLAYQDIFHLCCFNMSRRKLSIIRTAVNSAWVSPRYVVFSAPRLFLWRCWFLFFFSLLLGSPPPALLLHKVAYIIALADLSIGRLYVSVHRSIRQQTLLVPFEL